MVTERKRPRQQNHKTPLLKKQFLAAFPVAFTITGTAKAVGVDPHTVHDWLNNDPEFLAAFELVKAESIEILEAEARRRAFEGVSKPVFYKGDVCGTEQDFSDTLMIFLLKGGNPDKYKDRLDSRISGKLIIEDRFDDSNKNSDSPSS